MSSTGRFIGAASLEEPAELDRRSRGQRQDAHRPVPLGVDCRAHRLAHHGFPRTTARTSE